MTTRWTHALRWPGPNPDRCQAVMAGGTATCGCVRPDPVRGVGGVPTDALECVTCHHELVPQFSLRPSDSPVPRT